MSTTTATTTTTNARTALVTGATSGLGLEAAAHLAEAGVDPVVVTGRTMEKADRAASELARRTRASVFRPLALDLGSASGVVDAAEEVAASGTVLDVVILNAGMVAGSGLDHTDDGVEIAMASSLTGHHRLTMGLLARGAIAGDARIVVSGSEAARGDVPTFHPADVRRLAARSFDDDLVAAATWWIRRDTVAAGPRYRPADQYATTKLFVAHWAAALARRLPDGTTVNAVSPGSAPDTQAIRNGNLFMRRVMVPVMKAMPRRMGLAATTPDAARRYIGATTFDATVNGQFFASAPKKMTGPLHRVDLPHVRDEDVQEAVWEAVLAVTGAPLPTVVRPAASDRAGGARTRSRVR